MKKWTIKTCKNYPMSFNFQDKLLTEKEQYPVIVRDKKSGSVHLSKLIPSTKVPFYGTVGTVKSVRKLQSGDWHVECTSKSQQENLSKITDLAGVSVTCFIPTKSSDGIVYNLPDPLALRYHTDVVKFQVISDTSDRAEVFTTRIIFATETLPTKLHLKGIDYNVIPFSRPQQRCTNCQRLTHTKHTCSFKTRCSRCGKGHPRSQCQAHKPMCANCQGPHSAAYRHCPLQNNVTNNNSASQSLTKGKGNLKPQVDDSNTVPSATTYADRTRSTSVPSFINFIMTVVIPILSLDKNVNLVNQLYNIYTRFFGINEQINKITTDIRKNAESLLLTRKSKANVPSEEEHCSTSSECNKDMCHENDERKQLRSLKNLNIDKETKNILIGDSTTKGMNNDNDKETQIFCIPGLTIDDIVNWLDTIQHMKFKLDNVIFHVGINSCRKMPISKSMWDTFINVSKSKFPQSNLHFSSILPHTGNLKKKIQESNFALKHACDNSDTFFVNNRSHFVTYTGQPKTHLFSRDGIHPSKTGSSVLSNNLFSVLGKK